MQHRRAGQAVRNLLRAVLHADDDHAGQISLGGGLTKAGRDLVDEVDPAAREAVVAEGDPQQSVEAGPVHNQVWQLSRVGEADGQTVLLP